jgi:hypothetical protein
MRGSVYKRCPCRDASGRKVKGCRKAHGSWGYTVELGVDSKTGRRRQATRGGFRTREEAEEARTKALASVQAGLWANDAE